MKNDPNIAQGEQIRTVVQARCAVCGNNGIYVYEGVEDRLFGVPGRWNIRKCATPDCGTCWLDPRPISADISKLYARYYTHDAAHGSTFRRRLNKIYRDAITAYTNRKFGGYASGIGCLGELSSYLLYLTPGRRADAEARAMTLPVMRGGRLLEVGFGAGEVLERLVALGWNAEGVESDALAVNRALAHGLKVRLGNLQELTYPDESFDAVVSNHVLEHLSDAGPFLVECYRILKPGGIVVAYTPNAEAFGHKMFGSDWVGLDPPRHLNLFTAKGLSALAMRAGFSVQRCGGSGRGSQALYQSYLLRRGKAVPGHSLFGEEILAWLAWGINVVNARRGEELLIVGKKQLIQGSVSGFCDASLSRGVRTA